MLLGFAGVCGAWFPRGRVSVRFALFSVPSFSAWCVVAPPLGGLVGALVDLLGVLGFSVCFLLLVCWGFFSEGFPRYEIPVCPYGAVSVYAYSVKGWPAKDPVPTGDKHNQR
jgi:hypothetical protein